MTYKGPHVPAAYVHSVAMWTEIFTQYQSSFRVEKRALVDPKETANTILNDLLGYRQNARTRLDDAIQLGNALQAIVALVKRETAPAKLIKRLQDSVDDPSADCPHDNTDIEAAIALLKDDGA